ncbi:MAG: methylated-DNA--[protein]-cysteine S-methyltransferase [Xanthobacteraceae bacterium]
MMTSDLSFTLFDTAIGCCGIVWNARGIAGVQLPEKSDQATRSRVQRRFPAAREIAPPAVIQRVIEAIGALLRGQAIDLTDVDLDGGAISEFNRRVYDVARGIRPGATLSYGEIAERLGDRTLAREVAQALSENPFPIIVPCHRVLAAGGKMGGFSGPGGVRTKLRLLSIERARYGEPGLFEHLPWEASSRRHA